MCFVMGSISESALVNRVSNSCKFSNKICISMAVPAKDDPNGNPNTITNKPLIGILPLLIDRDIAEDRVNYPNNG